MEKINFSIAMDDNFYKIIDDIKKGINTNENINMMLQNPKLLNLQDKNGNTILMYICLLKKYDLIYKIINELNSKKIYIDLNLKNIKGDTFLEYLFNKSTIHDEYNIKNILNYFSNICDLNIYFTNEIGLKRYKLINNIHDGVYSELVNKYNILKIKKNIKLFFDNYRNIIFEGPTNTLITILIFLTLYDELELIKYLCNNYSDYNLLYKTEEGKNALYFSTEVLTSFRITQFLINEGKTTLNKDEYIKYISIYDINDINLFDSALLYLIQFYMDDNIITPDINSNFRNKLNVLLNTELKMNLKITDDYIQIQSLLFCLINTNDYNMAIKNVILFKKYLNNNSKDDVLKAINFTNTNDDNLLTYAVISDVEPNIINIILQYDPVIQDKIKNEVIIKQYLNKKNLETNILESEKIRKQIELEEDDKIKIQKEKKYKKDKKKKVNIDVNEIILNDMSVNNINVNDTDIKVEKYKNEIDAIDNINIDNNSYKQKLIEYQNDIITTQAKLRDIINKLQLYNYEAINNSNSFFIENKSYLPVLNCDIVLCGVLAISCYFTNNKFEDLKENIGIHGLWPETKFDKYIDYKDQIKNFNKLNNDNIRLNLDLNYVNLGNYIENNKQKYSCHPNLEEDLKKMEWRKHGIYANKYENTDEYFVEMCELGKPILNLIRKHIFESMINDKTYDFESIKEVIINSEFNKYLNIIKDDSKLNRNVVEKSFYSQEFYFNICRIKIRIDNKDVYKWKFCKNDVKETL